MRGVNGVNCSFDCNSFWPHIQCFAVPLNSQRGSFAGGYAGHDGSIPASEHFTVGHSSLEGGAEEPKYSHKYHWQRKQPKTPVALSCHPCLLPAVANSMNDNSNLQRTFFLQCAIHRLKIKSMIGKRPTR